MQRNSWQHQYIISNGIQLHYVTQGEGPLLLLLHGFPEFWYSWRYQIPEFARSYKVVALDLRGYNESDKPSDVKAYRMSELILDVVGIIRGLGYNHCTLVGHDWGGAIAWNFAYNYPELLEKLIILNLPHPAKFSAGIKTPQQLLRSWYMFFFQLPFLPEFLFQAGDYQLIADAFKRTSANPEAFTSEDLEAYRNAAAKRGALTAMINYYRNIFEFLGKEQSWPILRIPTLMIWGEKDEFLSKELTYGTEEYVQDLTIQYLPEASHWVQQDQPDLVNQYMWKFLRAGV